jgi:hypothetical protein
VADAARAPRGHTLHQLVGQEQRLRLGIGYPSLDLGMEERCPPRQKARVERLKAKADILFTEVIVANMA